MIDKKWCKKLIDFYEDTYVVVVYKVNKPAC